MGVDTIILGRTNWRDRQRPFGLKEQDRFMHLYAVGQTGTGKSTFLEHLIGQDLDGGRGLAFFDPHGDAVEALALDAHERLRDRLVYLNAPDAACPVAFNPLESVPEDQRPLAASGIIEAFRNVWGQWWGPRLEHFFRNGLLTLLDQPHATLGDLPRLYLDDRFRREALTRVRHPAVRDFWALEFARYTIRQRTEALSPLLNKLGAFLSQPPLYRILVSDKPSLDCRKVMDEGQVLLVNLAKGRIGADGCSLLGALLVSRLGLTALSRADVPEVSRRSFFVYLDEFQSFTTLSVAGMLSELRKYRVGLILAHQYMDQLAPEIRDAVLGNAGTIVCFRVGPGDVSVLGRYFSPELEPLDLMNLPNYHVYVRLMVDGQATRPFSATTLQPERGRRVA